MNEISSMYDRSHFPLYAQVASVLRQRIESGYWLVGDKISTLDELEQEFAVARVTIRQAIKLLRQEGLLNAKQGRGTFVSGKPQNDRWLNLANDFESVVKSIKDNVIKNVLVKENVQPPNLCGDEGDVARTYSFLKSVQYNRGQPFSVVNLHLASEIFDKAPERFTKTAALPNLIEMEEITITNAYQTLTIGVANPETAEFLKIGLGEPTLDCHLVLLDDKHVAIYVAEIHYHKDCFVLRADLLEKLGPLNKSKIAESA